MRPHSVPQDFKHNVTTWDEGCTPDLYLGPLLPSAAAERLCQLPRQRIARVALRVKGRAAAAVSCIAQGAGSS